MMCLALFIDWGTKKKKSSLKNLKTIELINWWTYIVCVNKFGESLRLWQEREPLEIEIIGLCTKLKKISEWQASETTKNTFNKTRQEENCFFNWTEWKNDRKQLCLYLFLSCEKEFLSCCQVSKDVRGDDAAAWTHTSP